jgi:hypothetical protein
MSTRLRGRALTQTQHSVLSTAPRASMAWWAGHARRMSIRCLLLVHLGRAAGCLPSSAKEGKPDVLSITFDGRSYRWSSMRCELCSRRAGLLVVGADVSCSRLVQLSKLVAHSSENPSAHQGPCGCRTGIFRRSRYQA